MALLVPNPKGGRGALEVLDYDVLCIIERHVINGIDPEKPRDTIELVHRLVLLNGVDLPEATYERICSRICWKWDTGVEWYESCGFLLWNWSSFFKAVSMKMTDPDFLLDRSQFVTPMNFVAGYWLYSLQGDTDALFHPIINGGALVSSVDFRRNDVQLFKNLVKVDRHHFRFAGEDLMRRRDAVIEVVKSNGNVLEVLRSNHVISNRWGAVWRDEALVLAAVRNAPMAIQYANDRCRGEVMEIVLAAVRGDGHALQHVGFPLKWDEEVNIAAVTQQPFALRHSPMKDNRNVVLAAVASNGLILQHAAPHYQNDDEVVRRAVETTPSALMYASWQKRSDRDIVLCATRKQSHALMYANPRFFNDLDLIQQSNIQLADAVLRVKKNGMKLEAESAVYRSDYVVVYVAVEQNGLALQFASNILRAQPAITAAAVAQNREARKFARVA